MSHVRQQLRDVVETALLSSLIAEGRVFVARAYPVDEADLPAVLIYTNNEVVEPAAGRKVIRSVELVIEVIDKGDAIDDKLDALSVTVEENITPEIFGDLIRQIDLSGTEKQFNEGGNYQTGSAAIKYQIIYLTKESNPQISE